MADFVLLSLKRGEQGNIEKKPGLLERIKRIFVRKKPVFTGKTVSLNDEVLTSIIEVPYTSDEIIRGGKPKFNETVSTILNQFEAGTVYLPGSLGVFADKEGPARACPRPRNLFKSLLPNILGWLYSEKGKNLGDLNLVFIQGENPEALFELINYISPLVRYVTAVVTDKNEAAGFAEAIYEECGLPIGLSTDLKSSIKSADIIINLADSCYFNKPCRTGPKALVIDLRWDAASRKIEGGTVVRGIEAGLPGTLVSELGEELIGEYNPTFLAEIFVLAKAGLSIEAEAINVKELEKVKTVFYRSGFSLNALMGRHNLVRFKSPEDIL